MPSVDSHLRPSALLPSAADHPFVRTAGTLVPRWFAGRTAAANLILDSLVREDGPAGPRIVAAVRSPAHPFRLTLRIDVFSAPTALRWSVEVTNTSDRSARLADGAALDLGFERLGRPPTVTFFSAGAPSRSFPPAAFRPIVRTPSPGADGRAAVRIADGSGRAPPLFLVDDPDANAGMFCGLCHAGCHRSEVRLSGTRLEVVSGPAALDAELDPGETLVLPGALIGFCDADAASGLRVFLRRLQPARPAPLIWSVFHAGDAAASEATLQPQIAAAAAAGCGHFVLNAPWWAGARSAHDLGAGLDGFREDPARFPNGLRAVADAVRSAGMGFGLALDLERADIRGGFAQAHPECLLLPDGARREHCRGSALLDFAQEPVRARALEIADGLIGRLKLSWLRWESAVDPSPLLSAADEPGRSGVSELNHGESLYRTLEELRRRRPEVVLEFGLAGGRRLDPRFWEIGDCFRIVETVEPAEVVRRIVLGAGECLPADRLLAELAASPEGDGGDLLFHCGAGLAIARPVPAALSATLAGVRKFLAGDSRPLAATPSQPGDADGRQYHDPRSRSGFLLLHHRTAAGPPDRFRLRGLDPDVTYRFRDPDGTLEFYRTGRMAMEEGLDFTTISTRPGPLLLYSPVG